MYFLLVLLQALATRSLSNNHFSGTENRESYSISLNINLYISIHPHGMEDLACFYVPVLMLDSLLDQRPFEDRWKGNNSILQMWLPH